MTEAKAKDVSRKVSKDYDFEQERKEKVPVQDDGEAAKAEEVEKNRDEATEEEDEITKGKGSMFEHDGLPSHPTGDAAPAEVLEP